MIALQGECHCKVGFEKIRVALAGILDSPGPNKPPPPTTLESLPSAAKPPIMNQDNRCVFGRQAVCSHVQACAGMGKSG